MSNAIRALALIAFASASISVVAAAEPEPTKIVIAGEMCGGCVKKITATFKKSPGVERVVCDIPTMTVTVVPKQGATLSPKVLWKAMESAGKQPTKLTGPAGEFTAAPKT